MICRIIKSLKTEDGDVNVFFRSDGRVLSDVTVRPNRLRVKVGKITTTSDQKSYLRALM